MRQPPGIPEVKICGITREEDARAAWAAGAAYLGLVFAASSRRVGLKRARSLAAAVPEARWVGVFAGAAAAEILSAAAAVPFRVAQLHGDEDLGTAEEVRAEALEVWQAVPVDAPPDWGAVEGRVAELAGRVDAVLLDRRVAGRMGGAGVPFDWGGLPAGVRRLLAGHRFVLSGGLDPGNVAAAVRRLDPDVVDVSSGVEIAPGRKDGERIRRFVGALRGVAPARLSHRSLHE